MVGFVDQVFGDSTTPVAALGPAGHVLYCNRAMTKLPGLVRPPLGEPCHEVFQGTDQDGRPLCSADCEHLERAMSSDRPQQPYLMRCRPLDGDGTLVESTLLPIHGPPGTRGLCLQMCRPIDASDELERILSELWGIYRSTDGAGTKPPPRASSPLTPRESEVLASVELGLRSDQIAGRLGIRTATVRNHVQKILAKLKAHSRLEAVKTARDNGWL